MQQQRKIQTQGRSANAALPQIQSKGNPSTNRAKRARRNRKTSPAVAATSLLPCTRGYLQALLDPFGFVGREPPCIPDMYDTPSFKFSTMVRTAVTTGTTGFGFVAVYPKVYNNNVTFARVSNVGYTGSTFTSANVGGVTNILDAQYPFAVAAPRKVRLVALGVRCRYIGSELDRAGRVVPTYANAQGDNLDGENITQVLSRPNHISLITDRNWKGAIYSPSNPDDYLYTSNASSLDAAMKLGIAFEAPPGLSWEVEIVRHFEALPYYDGYLMHTVPTQTRSHSDLLGFSYVRDFLGSIPVGQMGSGLYNVALAYIARLANPTARFSQGAATRPMVEYL